MRNKADQYFTQTLKQIRDYGDWDQDPRPKWGDGTPAHSKFISQQSFKYHIIDGEFPIQSFRPTAVKGGFHDIEAIYQKQTNIIEEMHESIQSWWTPFVVSELMIDSEGFKVSKQAYNKIGEKLASGNFSDIKSSLSDFKLNSSIGQTYGHTVKRYNLMNNLLDTMENDPFGRRHIINLWQEQQRIEDPKALVPCAYETVYTITETKFGLGQYERVRYVDQTLNQRSQDYIVTASINSIQYVELGLMICGHLEHKTGIKHILRTFVHNVQNVHIYDRHLFAIDELLKRKPSNDHFTMELPVKKNFYDYTFGDFVINNPYSKVPLSQKLEIAV